jgi:hypothetical protein
MRIVVEPMEVRKGLRQLRATLVAALGEPILEHWSFPGASQDDRLPTWSGTVEGSPFTIAIGDEGRWTSRTPVLLAREESYSGMTSVVEINVPVADGRINRKVNGCLCMDDNGDFFRVHRGTRFTVTPYVVTKASVHKHFAKWLTLVDDGDEKTPVIPVGPIVQGFVEHALAFADAVAILKQTWAESQGNVGVAEAALGWSEDLNFADVIERSTSESRELFEYRHGPLQTNLMAVLRQLLPSGCRVVRNQRIDLGILRGTSLDAIFEVKTGLGHQIYCAIGQLLCYQAQFGHAATRLIVVLPSEACSKGEATATGQLLQKLGIDLLMGRGQKFRTWDGSHLRQLPYLS